MARSVSEVLQVAGREVIVTNPGKLYFPEAGITKLELVQYYLRVAEGALRGVSGRPMALKRFVEGATGEAFFQKRAPENRPEWTEVAELRFPSGRTAQEIVIRDAAQLAWVVNLGCIDLNPHPVRADDVDHPDELRVDLDPVPGVPWDDVRRVALVAREVLAEHGLTGWPKTSGSRGMHVWVRIARRWGFDDVRQAALALAREVERRAPAIASSKWWKEERHGVFLDYNQNAKDRTTASAYSVRPLPDARVSTPLSWDEVPDCEPADFTLLTVPDRLGRRGDPHAAIDDDPGDLARLLELAARQRAEGQEDAPWPPHYAKGEAEPPRAPPSRRRTGSPDPGARPDDGAGAEAATSPARRAGGRRRPSAPLVTVAKAAHRDEALAGLERWRARHPEASERLAPDDVLVDAMRGRSSTWTRVRVNLRHVPPESRPVEEAPDPDFEPGRP
jgi:DNA ligase D-like protein (predicted polymerase)